MPSMTWRAQWQSVTPGEGRAPTRQRPGGASHLLRTGADITLAGYGMMLNQLLDCADRLARNGIQAEGCEVKCHYTDSTGAAELPLFKRQDGFWLRRTARRRAVWGSASPQACLTLASRCEGWPWRIPDTPLLPMERCPSFKGCAVWTGRAISQSIGGLPSWLM